MYTSWMVRQNQEEISDMVKNNTPVRVLRPLDQNVAYPTAKLGVETQALARALDDTTVALNEDAMLAEEDTDEEGKRPSFQYPEMPDYLGCERANVRFQNIEPHVLTPGEIFEVREGEEVPCDAVLVEGSVVVNEAALTGEPAPVSKSVIPMGPNRISKGKQGKRHFLFAGTQVIQSTNSNSVHADQLREDQGKNRNSVVGSRPRSRSENEPPIRALACAYHIGSYTRRGEMIRDILEPASLGFTFYDQLKTAYWIFGILACLAIFIPYLNYGFTEEFKALLIEIIVEVGNGLLYVTSPLIVVGFHMSQQIVQLG